MTDTDLREQITKILFGSTDEPNGLAAAIVNEVEALIREREARAVEEFKTSTGRADEFWEKERPR